MSRAVQGALGLVVGAVWGAAAGQVVSRLIVALTPHGYDTLTVWAASASGGLYGLYATLVGPRLCRDLPGIVVLVWLCEFVLGFCRYVGLGDLEMFWNVVVPVVFREALHWMLIQHLPLGLLVLAGTYPMARWIRRRAAEAEAEAGAAKAARSARNEDGTWNVG